MTQAPSSVFMVRPDHFGFNTETAKSNAFQHETLLCENHNCRKEAQREFEEFVNKLKKHHIDVKVFDSPKDHQAPDAVFPNNWISFHADGKVIIYPMLTPNRRIERRQGIIDEIGLAFEIKEIMDISHEEDNGRILEGTGSIIFDHINKTAYANESPRTNKELFFEVCQKLGYEGVFFKAVDEHGQDIYHTNVLMTIGDGFAIVCKESMVASDQDKVIRSLFDGGLEIIDISYEQMRNFAGNMIQLTSKLGHNYLVMSHAAFTILTTSQKEALSNYADFIFSDLHTIETVGGGSARCMLAGIHLLRK